MHTNTATKSHPNRKCISGWDCGVKIHMLPALSPNQWFTYRNNHQNSGTVLYNENVWYWLPQLLVVWQVWECKPSNFDIHSYSNIRLARDGELRVNWESCHERGGASHVGRRLAGGFSVCCLFVQLFVVWHLTHDSQPTLQFFQSCSFKKNKNKNLCPQLYCCSFPHSLLPNIQIRKFSFPTCTGYTGSRKEEGHEGAMNGKTEEGRGG